MANSNDNPVFCSAFANLMQGFVAEKRAGGCKYRSEVVYLRDLDRFLSQTPHTSGEFPKDIVERWTRKRPNERPNTHVNRIGIVRQFALYLNRRGIPAYVPPPGTGSPDHYGFIPRIFTHAEVQRIFHEVDALRRFSHFPLRHIVMPEIFRILYGCGLRVGEALALQVRDVDLRQGILTIRHAKFDKERLVAVSPSLHERLGGYSARLGVRGPDAAFFTDGGGKHIRHGMVYRLFREILWKMKIPHAGHGQGPRVHDLRHTFAVHRLLEWYREGADLNEMLPILSTYMGHNGMVGTQRYLHLVPELFPEVTKRLEETVGHIIPGGDEEP